VTSSGTLDIDVDVRREYLFDTVSEPAYVVIAPGRRQ
jgi:hypothetical protein